MITTADLPAHGFSAYGGQLWLRHKDLTLVDAETAAHEVTEQLEPAAQEEQEE
jgi:hypothetical protein